MQWCVYGVCMGVYGGVWGWCACSTAGWHVVKAGANLEVLSEVCEAVSLGELQLHTSEASQGSSKAGEALLAAAAHPHQQGVASGLAHDACYAGNVVHRILEEDEAHGLAAAAVVVCQELLQGAHQLGMVSNLCVRKIQCQSQGLQVVQAGDACGCSHIVAIEAVKFSW